MTLHARLDAARDDYRALPAPDVADLVSPPEPAMPARPRTGRRFLAAATVIGLVAGGFGWWRHVDQPPKVDVEPAAEVPKSNDPDPVGAIAPHSADVTLAPDGPYTEDQVVTVSVPEGFAEDLLNGGARQCVVLDDGPAGPGEWCGPDANTIVGERTSTSVGLRVERRVFTPTGHRDCEEVGVTCRVVVRRTGGADAASAVLRFDGPAAAGAASIDVSGTETPGGIEIRPVGLEPHPSWVDLRATDPQRAAGFGPFWVSVCAFGEAEPPTDPWGAEPWGTTRPAGSVPSPNCDGYRSIAVIDADDPNGSISADVPTAFLGYSGWSDCRVDHCFVQIRRYIVHGFEPGGGLLGSDEVAATALVASDLVDPDGVRASLRIVSRGPHAAGQEVTIEVEGLRGDDATSIGICSSESPWGCGYIGGVDGAIVNGRHVIRLPDTFACRTRCYLELASQGEGMPPLATAALETGG